MRVLLCVGLILFTTQLWARNCEVYGISDSPQTLNCHFKRTDVKLRCKNGTYYLNQSKVDQAFHMEVEEGAVPLVFKTPDIQLTVVIESKIDIQAELEQNGKISLGSCD